MTKPSSTEPADAVRPGLFGLTAVVNGWRTFWFSFQPAYTLGAVRIAFGALAVAWTLSLGPDLYVFFGREGIAPSPPTTPHQWTAFEVWPSNQALLIGWALLLLASVAMTIGWHSRLAAALVFVLILSFQFRNPTVFNAGDGLVRIEALFLAFSPCGAALSLDQRRRAGSFFSAQERPRWPVRMLQLQLSLIYLATVQVKMTGNTWTDGTAVSYALRLQDMLIIPAPQWFIDHPLLMNVATWGTLALEVALGILVWVARVRPYVLAAGVVMHLTIMVTIGVGFFTPAVLVLYLAFTPPETLHQLVSRRRSADPTDTDEQPDSDPARDPTQPQIDGVSCADTHARAEGVSRSG